MGAQELLAPSEGGISQPQEQRQQRVRDQERAA